MTRVFQPAALVLAGAFAIAACAQPPTAPATPAPKATPPATAKPAADASVSNPIKEASTMPPPGATEPEYGPAIPAAQLRKRILDLIGSFRSLKDLERENVERALDVRLTVNPEAEDGFTYVATTTEGWLYRVDLSHFSPKGSPATVEVLLSNGVDDSGSSTNQKPAYCTFEFEPIAKELVAMGYERGQRPRYAGGDQMWGFGREISENKASFGIGVSIYELTLPDLTKQICIKGFNMGGGVVNG